MRKPALPLALAALVIAGCGGSGRGDPSGVTASDPVAAFKKVVAAWKRDDARTACAATTASYQHKLAAELEVFGGSCSLVVAEIHKQVTGPDRIELLSMARSGERSVVVRSRTDGEVVRTRYDLREQNGRWQIVDDRSLDAIGPKPPVAAYRAQNRDDDPEILWSEVKGDSANIWEISGNGRGTYVLSKIRMSKRGGKWKVVSSETVGTAPPNVKVDNSTTT